MVEVTKPPLAPTLRWHVCPQCGLAGWAREGFGYCRLHSERPEESFAALAYPAPLSAGVASKQ
jgi:hypothetical protein